MSGKQATNIVALRQRAQHLIRPDFASAADVVRWFGAVQAQDFPSALYGIGLRMRTATESSVAEAVQRGSIVRTWPMRGTLHFVPAEDARWMVKLLGERQIGKARGYHLRAGLEPGIFRRAGRVLEKILRDETGMTRAEIYRALDSAGIHTTGTQRGLFIVAFWAQQGLICLGPRRGKQQTFMLLEEWVRKSRELKGEEALAELAARYFRSHGPATVQDFAWWAGLRASEAREAVEAVHGQLLSLTPDGREYFMASDLDGSDSPGRQALALPPFDEFTVAYADRSALIDASRVREVGFAIGRVIVLAGRVVGTWTRSQTAQGLVVRVKFIERPNGRQVELAKRAARRYARFIGQPLKVEV